MIIVAANLFLDEKNEKNKLCHDKSKFMILFTIIFGFELVKQV